MSNTAGGRERGTVLVLGICLSDVTHLAHGIMTELQASREWDVEQSWTFMGETPPGELPCPATAHHLQKLRPKFRQLNRVLEDVDLGRVEHLLVCDDDVRLPAGFLDHYLELVERFELTLAQPARTHGSFIDWPMVEQLDGLVARRTRFVEIGPVFSIRRDLFDVLLPFDESTPMGWGLDFAWPVAVERAGRHMGIVDATPVDHSLRPPVANYDHSESSEQQRAFLERTPHLQPLEAFHILESYT